MSPRDRLISLRLESRVLAALEDTRRKVGVPVSEQIRRAVGAWLARGGVLGHVDGVEQAPSTPERQTARTRGRTRGRA